MSDPMWCSGCSFTTDVIYDAAAHSYSLGEDHPTFSGPRPVNKGGRPPIGPAINMRLPQDLLDMIDALAVSQRPRISRAEWIRRALSASVSAPR